MSEEFLNDGIQTTLPAADADPASDSAIDPMPDPIPDTMPDTAIDAASDTVPGTASDTASDTVPCSASDPLQPPASDPQPVDGEYQAALDGEESFEAMLEKTFKPINTGDRVSGMVTAVTSTEVQVDLGAKHAGYIPLTELSADPDAKPEEIAQVGQMIEASVVRINDVEGIIALSKRRLDSVNSWNDVEHARENHAVLSGIVTEDNKGGVVVSIKGVRVFVPASLTGLPKEVPMSTLLRRRVKVVVTEVNRARRRVVGSIRAAMNEERRAMADKLWEDIEVGQRYKGVVKSLTSFGCFVDIGGVDGMVHISELSWSRIKHPSEVVEPGQNIDVFVIGFDREKKKISLGHKNPDDNPWQKFADAYHVDDVVSVRVVKLMPFGAFSEIIPGVDGLIHIGQITDRRIGKPGDVLTEGQQVDVKITAIDYASKKISLSMRALMEPEYPSEEAQAEQAGLPDVVVATASADDDTDAAMGDAPTVDAPADAADATDVQADEAADVQADEA